MKLRLFMTLSLLGNVALVALLLCAGRTAEPGGRDAERGRHVAAPAASRLKTNVTRIQVALTNEAPPFHWRDVASEDFKQYAAGLRSVGCPPGTVRDIIKAELTTLYLARRRGIVEPFQREYWTVAAKGEELDDATKPYEEAVKKLEKETLDKLDEYAGGPAESKDEKRRHSDPETAFLPDEKRKAFESLQQQFDADMAKLRPAGGAKDTPELRAQREAREKQRQESIAALFSPEEQAEYQLRRSRHAGEAQASTGFAGTPEEARAIARAYNQFPEPSDNFNRKDPDYAAKKAAAEQIRRQRDEAVKEALGPGRHAQFKQGFDGNFRDVFRIAERYGLPREAASQAAEALRARNEELDRLRSFGLIAADGRGEQELAVRQASYAALRQALGERALRTYERYHGPMMPSLDPSARE
jgi:hypothetical protein